LETTASQFGLERQIVKNILDACREVLFQIRKKRPRPGLDNKMLTAWNGMYVSVVLSQNEVSTVIDIFWSTVNSDRFWNIESFSTGNIL
jgi:uncharacterized protein YyaL (SSP411 family)